MSEDYDIVELPPALADRVQDAADALDMAPQALIERAITLYVRWVEMRTKVRDLLH